MAYDAPNRDRAAASADIRTSDFVIGGLRYRQIRLPRPGTRSLSVLTKAELDVARRAACGQSTKRIAEARGSSVRTVSHQLASIYRKLSLACRADLCSCVFREEQGS